MPQGARPQVARPRGGRGGRARRGLDCDQYDLGPHGSGFGFYPSSGPCFSCGDRFPPSGPCFRFRGDRFASWPRMSDFSADPFSKQMAQHWYAPQFTNPSVESFAYPMAFY
jgi:hypothetical protein